VSPLLRYPNRPARRRRFPALSAIWSNEVASVRTFGRGEGNPPPHQYELELARLLLEAGADPNDSQTLYNRSWFPGDEWLELLFAYGLGAGSGGAGYANPILPASLRFSERGPSLGTPQRVSPP